MSKKLTVLFCMIFMITGIFAQDRISTLKSDVIFLSSDELQGRQTGTIFQDIAAQYIGSRMMSIGLMPAGDNKNYYQNFYHKMPADPHANKPHGLNEHDSVKITNVVGLIDNHASKTIVIGAHYDHLGLGDNGFSLATDKLVHNGADDNASGVSAILDLATQLSKIKSNYNFVFLAFSGEEFGLWGSNYFTKNPSINLKNVVAMINLDMVGRLKEDKSIMIGGVGTSPIWEKQLTASNISNLKMTFDQSGSGPSDHTSFYFKDIPVLFYFTGQHADYHKPTDDYDKVNFTGIQLITDNILQLVKGLNQIDEIPFTKTVDKKDEKVELKVTLGIMPDYMYDGTGLRIDGVKEGRPAANANLKSGDIILKMGPYPVDDIQMYMKALNSIKPGEKVTVIFKRDGNQKSGEVQF